jgi:hypothetical protein
MVAPYATSHNVHRKKIFPLRNVQGNFHGLKDKAKGKVKVKVSLCLITEHHAMSDGTASHILELGTGWR